MTGEDGAVSGDDRSADAVNHLRAAALEMIAAARAMLDLTEEMLKDPAPVLAAVTALAGVARQAAAAQAGMSPTSGDEHRDGADPADRSEPAPPDETGGGPTNPPRPGPRSRPRVQHIRVS